MDEIKTFILWGINMDFANITWTKIGINHLHYLKKVYITKSKNKISDL
jgi:alpha-galactosidase/6-phospho-beta-glucosidase family protein